MLQKLADAAGSLGALLEVKAQLALRETKAAGDLFLIRLAAALMCSVGAAALLVALMLALAPVIGWAGAVGLVGGVAAGGGGGVLLFTVRRRKATASSPEMSTDELRAEAERFAAELREQIAEATKSNGSEQSVASGVLSTSIEAVISKILQKPETIASAAFAILTIIGPDRALRAAARAASAAGVAASVMKAAKEVMPGAGAAGASSGRGSSAA